jgi:hypothetical protein
MAVEYCRLVGLSEVFLVSLPRKSSLLDVTELLKAGADVTKIRQYLNQHASALLPLFESLLQEIP